MRRLSRRSWLIGGVVAVAVAAGFALGRASAPNQARSGIQGKVILDARGGTEHRYFPQRACQRVLQNTNGFDANGRIVARFCSAKDGNYRVSVAPGKYMIVGDRSNSMQTTGSLLRPVGPVEVRTDAYTTQDIYYSNGGA